MTSVKKFNWKRALTIFLIVIVAFCATSMVATKIIYDSIFVRYDGQAAEVPAQLQTMVDSRQDSDFLSGENWLNGYLYRCVITGAKNGQLASDAACLTVTANERGDTLCESL